eukprot:CAMPEP_0185019218 /NCGR_PEP_ID=MMETSP1103-20130426/1856_1 /TAXON_ID=36769 /ORGANISM="Paraphysomonas bandaiensis, Strain Caron Lab Isolate" /LENGTH=331 /DNA_ID=CAMNT_0027549417 /DNA_START=177 /DNA_END=1172 /DNA_ORIENTATION=+
MGADQIEHVESLLENQLRMVRAQKAEMQSIREISSLFHETHPSPISNTTLCKEWFSDSVVSALNLEQVTFEYLMNIRVTHTMLGELMETMEEEADGIFSIDILTPMACNAVLDQTAAYVRFLNEVLQRRDMSNTELSAVTTLAKRPPSMSVVGLSHLESAMLWIVNALSLIAYPAQFKNGTLDWVQGFIAGYTHERRSETGDMYHYNELGARRSGLVTHTDDSEVTLNVALVPGTSYRGGDLVFRGMRTDGCKTSDTNIKEHFRFRPERIGQALVHLGRHIHEVEELTGGRERYNAIFWFRSSKLRSEVCPCCWMNNSTRNGECICGEAWN